MPYAVVQQRDVIRGDDKWAEMDGNGKPIAYRTERAARRAMWNVALGRGMPHGMTPEVWGGYLVRLVRPSLFLIVKDGMPIKLIGVP